VRGDLRIPIFALLLAPGMLSQDVPVFRETATLVTVPCVVTDGHGLTISDLKIDDFRLYVDGAQRKIDNLWPEGDLPLLLGIIEDVSQSQQNRISENARVAAQLMLQIIHKQDRAFLVAVNDDVILKEEVTAGPYGLRNRFLPLGGEPLGVPCGAFEGTHGHKRPACGGTALWNAVYASAHLKLNGSGGNKALLILSDGNDTGSTHSFSDALEEVQRSGTVVYAIQYPDALSTAAPSDELSRLAHETGGLLFPFRGKDYSAMISRIAADIRGRYVLGFRPTTDDGGAGRLKVEVMRSGATVRSRQEYSGP
jgi:VWFA-related protein